MEDLSQNSLNTQRGGVGGFHRDTFSWRSRGCQVHCWCLVFILLLVPLVVQAEERSQPPINPHQAYPTDPEKQDGIIGVAVHLSAHRVGDPAKLYIRAVHPEGPAARAGLAHGDEILEVNGVGLLGKTYEQIIHLIRGKVGQSVTLRVKGSQGDRTISVVRISERELMGQQHT